MSFCSISKRLLSLLLLRCLGEELWLLDGEISVVVLLVGVDFAVLQFPLDDLVILNLHLFDLNLLWVNFLNWIFELLTPSLKNVLMPPYLSWKKKAAAAAEPAVDREMFFKIGEVLKKFTVFRGKYLCWSLQKRLQHRCFPVNIAKVLRTTLQNTSVGYFRKWALVEINCVLFYLIIVLRKRNQVRFELFSKTF